MMTARQHSHLHTEWMHQFPQLKSLSDFDQNLRNNVAGLVEQPLGVSDMSQENHTNEQRF